MYATKTRNGANFAKLNLLNTQTHQTILQIFSNIFTNDTNEPARGMVPTGALKCRRRRNAPASRVRTFTVEYYAGIGDAAVCPRILAQTFHRGRQRRTTAPVCGRLRSAALKRDYLLQRRCRRILCRYSDALCARVAIKFLHTHRRFTAAESADGRCAHANGAGQIVEIAQEECGSAD